MSTVDPPSGANTFSALEYARPRWQRRRRDWAITSVTILIAAIIGGLVYRHYHPLISQRRALIALHDRCLNYAIASNIVVYHEQFHAFTASRTGRTLIYPPSGDSGYMVKGSSWTWLEPSFLRSQTMMGTSAPATKGIARQGLLFLHARRALGNPVRLVCVEVNTGRLCSNVRGLKQENDWTFRTRVVRPASLISAGAVLSEQTDPIAGWTYPIMGLLIYGGQPDTQDDSHFTISFDPTSTFTRTIDGWLLPDDTVKLVVRPSAVDPAN